jgi:hypothetical protein
MVKCMKMHKMEVNDGMKRGKMVMKNGDEKWCENAVPYIPHFHMMCIMK